MSAQATETRSAAAVGDLAELILAAHGDAAAGARLPTERQLVAELGVTRTAIRHALAILEAQGRVSREVGRGTFIRGTQPRRAAGARSAQGVDDFGPAEVMAARRLIEPQVLPLVVNWATTRDFDELRRCLDGGASASTAEEFEVWDYALHHAIVAASRNQLLVRMYAVVERAREGELWGSLKRRNDSLERRAVYQSEHEAIVGALVARELAAALAAMEDHLVRVEANLLGAATQ
ncbi:MAG TPA: FCD domain-containing protein [Solirubrobacteraceae bacterium]|nr:FCD domain-containing protein [Solirubrobacteraceae bacterium]